MAKKTPQQDLEVMFYGYLDSLITLDSAVAIAMKRAVAKGLFTHSGALHKKANFILVGHADATVHLHAFGGNQVVGVVETGFAQARQLSGILRV